MITFFSPQVRAAVSSRALISRVMKSAPYKKTITNKPLKDHLLKTCALIYRFNSSLDVYDYVLSSKRVLICYFSITLHLTYHQTF